MALLKILAHAEREVEAGRTVSRTVAFRRAAGAMKRETRAR
jgi:hypothetical protein